MAVATMPTNEITASTAAPLMVISPRYPFVGHDWLDLVIRVIPKVLAYPRSLPARINPIDLAIRVIPTFGTSRPWLYHLQAGINQIAPNILTALMAGIVLPVGTKPAIWVVGICRRK